MHLGRYVSLIQNLPYLDQAFETKKANWQRECRVNETFAKFCQDIFEHSTLKLSRNDLFTATGQDKYQVILKVILWGYPRNMRGNNFGNILNYITDLEHLLTQNAYWSKAEFLEVASMLKGKSIGLSTLSKFLYFFKVKIDGVPCLILDQRIIDVFNSGLYEELLPLKRIASHNKAKLYLDYLTLMSDIANALKVAPDQLEYFLFQFGKNLAMSTSFNDFTR